jgi:pre-mRNA-processing factor 6
MDKRRKARRLVGRFYSTVLVFKEIDIFREAREIEEQKAIRAQRPKIQTQFADLKRGLSVVSDEEWENIPEVGNLTKKRKVRDFGRTYAVPDSIIVSDRNRSSVENSLDVRQQEV